MEVRFTLRNRALRNYDFFLGPGILFLVKLNNVIRCATYVGTLVTSIFYNTNKVMVMYLVSFLVNIVALVLLIMKESELQKYWMDYYELVTGLPAEGNKWDIFYAENYETIGGDPIPLLIANIVLPILLAYPLVKVISSPGLLIKGKISDDDKEESVELVKPKN